MHVHMVYMHVHMCLYMHVHVCQIDWAAHAVLVLDGSMVLALVCSVWVIGMC